MFDDLATAVKELNARDWRDDSDEELAAAVTELAKVKNALDSAEASLLATFDTRRVWAADGAKSAKAWMTRRSLLPKGECGSRLRLARSLKTMPLAADAMAAGEISATHVRRIASANNRRTATVFDRDQDRLVTWACTLTFDAFNRKVDYWLQEHDPDGADENDIDRSDRRRVNLAETFGGMFYGTMAFDPIRGTIVRDELDRREQALFEHDWAEAKTKLGRDPQPHELARTPEQRRARRHGRNGHAIRDHAR